MKLAGFFDLGGLTGEPLSTSCDEVQASCDDADGMKAIAGNVMMALPWPHVWPVPLYSAKRKMAARINAPDSRAILEP